MQRFMPHVSIITLLIIGVWPVQAHAACTPCGQIDSYGCCDNDTLKICNGSCLHVEVCGWKCQWDDTWWEYDCLGPFDDGYDEDPWSIHPRECPSCTPDCSGKECGDDGCGGSCGTCATDKTCDNEKCVRDCQPDCSGKECGDDGCGGSCGTCQQDETCTNGSCVPNCTPDCTGKECGDDGCGSTCGTCPANHDCINGKCECRKQCAGRQCGPDGCGGSCGSCANGSICTFNGLCCQPDCTGKECGGNGCDGQCGTCQSGYSCVGNKCVGGAPSGWICTGTKYRAADGCDCNCGVYDPDCDSQPVPAYNCPPNNVCTKEGACCQPDCTDKECGDDGCGGNCGTCSDGYICISNHCEKNETDQDIIVPTDTQTPDQDIIDPVDTQTPDQHIYDTSRDTGKDDAGIIRDILSDTNKTDSNVFVIDARVDGGRCPDGTIYRYGQCITVTGNDLGPSGASPSGGCSSLPGDMPTNGTGWLIVIILSLPIIRRLRKEG